MGRSRTHSDFATEHHPDVEVIIVFVQQRHVRRIVEHRDELERAWTEGLSITNADWGRSNARGRRGGHAKSSPLRTCGYMRKVSLSRTSSSGPKSFKRLTERSEVSSGPVDEKRRQGTHSRSISSGLSLYFSKSCSLVQNHCRVNHGQGLRKKRCDERVRTETESLDGRKGERTDLATPGTDLLNPGEPPVRAVEVFEVDAGLSRLVGEYIDPEERNDERRV